MHHKINDLALDNGVQKDGKLCPVPTSPINPDIGKEKTAKLGSDCGLKNTVQTEYNNSESVATTKRDICREELENFINGMKLFDALDACSVRVVEKVVSIWKANHQSPPIPDFDLLTDAQWWAADSELETLTAYYNAVGNELRRRKAKTVKNEIWRSCKGLSAIERKKLAEALS